MIKLVISRWVAYQLTRNMGPSSLIWKPVPFFLLGIGLWNFALNGFGKDSDNKEPAHHGLPKLDVNKIFEVKSFDGFNRNFETKTLELQAVELPSFTEKLKELPLAEWQSAKPDLYLKTLDLEKFESKQVDEKWSSKAPILLNESPLQKLESSREIQKEPLTSPSVETKELDPSRNINGAELRELLNHGGTVGPVKVGRDIESVTGKAPLKKETKEKPEKPSQPKSGPVP